MTDSIDPGLEDREREIRGDLPELSEDVPPSGDLTPADEATRADAPGLRRDPDSGPLVVDEEGAVVDTGSPQDYGEPNEEVERP
jgi:hypothetical protein